MDSEEDNTDSNSIRRRRAFRRFAEAHLRRPDNSSRLAPTATGRTRTLAVPGQPRTATDLEAGPDDHVVPSRPGRARRWVGIRIPAERTEVEGLNDPAPYEPAAKKDDDVELQNMTRPGAGGDDAADARNGSVAEPPTTRNMARTAYGHHPGSDSIRLDYG
ncbi:unnamed protein product [Parascedosporium putredinis]|uniref:Uncharacterized protein n=1 Tax=Parascedosporium putredinis TaxID=1442378 RepID=A0A9P1H492_9PEZI|nr:unnamed protein product [Parascedosporium putredinis]CAI7996515.1 unnamed protein product [Parascedosporium putredinis]